MNSKKNKYKKTKPKDNLHNRCRSQEQIKFEEENLNPVHIASSSDKVRWGKGNHEIINSMSSYI